MESRRNSGKILLTTLFVLGLNLGIFVGWAAAVVTATAKLDKLLGTNLTQRYHVIIAPHAGTISISGFIFASASSDAREVKVRFGGTICSANTSSSCIQSFTVQHRAEDGPLNLSTVERSRRPGETAGRNLASLELQLPDGTPCPVLGSPFSDGIYPGGGFECTGAPLAINTETLQEAQINLQGNSQRQSVIATGGIKPYTWRLFAQPGQVPPKFIFDDEFFETVDLLVYIEGEARVSTPYAPLKFGTYELFFEVTDSSSPPVSVRKRFDYKVVCGVPSENDTDDDGLKDCWELGGIDSDGDKQSDIVFSGPPLLEAGGADPQRKDVFVEVDWMRDHEPSPEVFLPVIKAFNEAPENGVGLHVLVDEEALPHSEEILFATTSNPSAPAGIPDADDTKDKFFGTAAERDAAKRNEPFALEVKRKVFRYALFAHNFYPICNYKRVAGLSDFTTKDKDPRAPRGQLSVIAGAALAALDRNPTPTHFAGTNEDLAATFMHELGHTLGFDEGGGDEITFKPNYISVMNYGFTYNNLLLPSRLDYSRRKLDPLHEGHLDERNGIGLPDGPQYPTAFGPPVLDPASGEYGPTIVGSVGPIDWNRNQLIEEGIPPQDLNIWHIPRSPGCDGRPPAPPQPQEEELIGFNDWASINVNLEDYPPMKATDRKEVVLAQNHSIQPLLDMPIDKDRDGIGFGDNCKTIYNPGQEDSDNDTIGDACDKVVPGDVNDDFKVDCQDLLIVQSAWGQRRGDVAWDTRADIDEDGITNERDISIVKENLGSIECEEDSDRDSDGITDTADNCPIVSNTNQTNSDNDSFGNACDGCPNDPAKFQAGICGCGNLDTDNDGDGIANCNDQCAADHLKTAPGVCGCGVPDTDIDKDGVANCNDNCPQIANANQLDSNDNGEGDACDVVAPSCAINSTAQVSVTRGGFRRNSATGRYVQQVTLKNTGASPLQGPVSLALDSLSSTATLFGKTGNTSCATPVSPYSTVNVGTDNVLSVGETATTVFEFTNPANAAISYNLRVLTGPNAR